MSISSISLALPSALQQPHTFFVYQKKHVHWLAVLYKKCLIAVIRFEMMTLMYVCVGFLTATVQEEAGNDHAVCQITSERFQKSLQRHLSMYVSFHHDAFKYNTSRLIPSVRYFIFSLPFVLLLGEETLIFFFPFRLLFSLLPCVLFYPRLLSLCLPLQMMPRGSFWKAQMTTSMQITSMWVGSSSACSFISLSISLCLVWGLVGGPLYEPSRHMLKHCGGHNGEWMDHINHANT